MTTALRPRHHELGSFLFWDLKVWAIDSWFGNNLLPNPAFILRQNIAIEAMNMVSASLEAACKKHRCTPRRSRRYIPMAASGREGWSAEIVIKRYKKGGFFVIRYAERCRMKAFWKQLCHDVPVFVISNSLGTIILRDRHLLPKLAEDGRHPE